MPSGYHLRAKQKACTNTSALCGSCGTGSLAQALVDIHDTLAAATLAVDLQASGPRLRIDSQHLLLTAVWTKQPSILCDQFSMFRLGLQHSIPLFFTYSTLFQDCSRAHARVHLMAAQTTWHRYNTQTDSGREAAGIDDIHIGKLLRCQHGILIAAGKVQTDIQMDDRVILRGQPGKNFNIVRGIDGSGLAKFS